MSNGKNMREHITGWAKRNDVQVYQARKHEGRFVLDFIAV